MQQLLRSIFSVEKVTIYDLKGANAQLEVEVSRLRSELGSTSRRLTDELTFRRILKRDVIKIEDLLRLVALPDLPKRADREAL